MRKLILGVFVSFCMISFSHAYELDGELGVKWTGFKTEKKAPVSGSFKDINLAISKADDLKSFLKSAKVKIDALSFDSKNPFRDKNITSTIFSLKSAETILASVVDVNSEKKMLNVALTMNEITKKIPMTYEIKDSKIIAKGSIEILDFALKESFLAFAKKCAAFHQNKSFSDVNIEFTLPFK